jgi:hypothetical protein
MDSMQEGYPDFLSQETPRFVIYKNNELYPFRRFIKDLRDKHYDIACRVSFGKQSGEERLRRTMVCMHKNTDADLQLDLAFEAHSSLDLPSLGQIFKGNMIAGYRSVYRLNQG